MELAVCELHDRALQVNVRLAEDIWLSASDSLVSLVVFKLPGPLIDTVHGFSLLQSFQNGFIFLSNLDQLLFPFVQIK